MKTTDFLKEGIGEDAHDMHKDHEVQMARQECYGAARDAIALHTLLKNISEMQGLEGWVSEKITLAADYLKTVHDYLEYEMMSKHEALPSFNMESADAALGAALSETNDYFKRRKDEEDRIAGTKPAKTRQQQQTDYMKRRKGEEDRIAGAKTAKKKTPVVIQTDKPIGVRVADIGPGGREYNVTTDKEWDKQKGVAEDADDTVGFSVETERAYQAVMDKYGDYIEHKESGIMYVPRRLWGRVEEVAYEADGIGATEDNGYENLEHYGVAEGLKEAIGGNYLYHATGADGLKGMLSTGSIRSATSPQKATQAQTALPTVSVTRDWGYASGANAQTQMSGIGRDAILVLDRNAIESNFKTLGTSQSTNIKGLSFNPYLRKDGEARSQNTDPMARANAKAKMKYAEPTAKAGGEFEEAVVVPKGALPLNRTMVGFWVNPKSELMKDPTILNDPRRLDMVRPNQFVKAKQTQGVAEGEYNPDTFVRKKATYKGYGLTQDGPHQWSVSASARKFPTLAAAKRHIDKNLILPEGFPHDVDHMPGPVIRNADMATDNVRTADKAEWERAVNSLNTKIFNDDSEFVGSSKGTKVIGNNTVWAIWNNEKQVGWFNAKGRALKPFPVKEAGVAESTSADLKKKISKFEELALAANRAGDDEKCKLYQRKIQALKQKMPEGVAEGALDEVKAKEITNGNGNGATGDPRIKLRRIKNKIKEYEDLIKQHSDGITDRVAGIIAKRDRLVNQKEKLEKAGVKEDASAGASSAGAVATVVAPLMKKPIKRKTR